MLFSGSKLVCPGKVIMKAWLIHSIFKFSTNLSTVIVENEIYIFNLPKSLSWLKKQSDSQVFSKNLQNRSKLIPYTDPGFLSGSLTFCEFKYVEQSYTAFVE